MKRRGPCGNESYKVLHFYYIFLLLLLLSAKIIICIEQKCGLQEHSTFGNRHFEKRNCLQKHYNHFQTYHMLHLTTYSSPKSF